MEDKIKKKKKLTLSISSKKAHNVPNYAQARGKTSVIIEKKISRRWGEKKFQPREDNTSKSRTPGGFAPKKPPINRNFDLRKIAEERATKKIRNLKEDNLQQKKSSFGKSKNFGAKREYKLTLSKALSDEELEGKERSLASVRRARLKEKKNLDINKQESKQKKLFVK